jgi:hypothetical protein
LFTFEGSFHWNGPFPADEEVGAPPARRISGDFGEQWQYQATEPVARAIHHTFRQNGLTTEEHQPHGDTDGWSIPFIINGCRCEMELSWVPEEGREDRFSFRARLRPGLFDRVLRQRKLEREFFAMREMVQLVLQVTEGVGERTHSSLSQRIPLVELDRKQRSDRRSRHGAPTSLLEALNPLVNVAPESFLRAIDAIEPGVWGIPSSITLVDGTSFEMALAWENKRFSDRGDWINPRNVAQLSECRKRMPAKWARVLHEAGESGMGYHIYVVELQDGNSFLHMAGNLVIDLVNLPPGYFSEDIVIVRPHDGRERSRTEGYRSVENWASIQYSRPQPAS